MTIRQVANVLGLKVRTIREWIRKGKLNAVKQGNHWEISSDEIYQQEVQERANNSREHSRRIKNGKKMGMLYRAGQDTEEPV